MRVSLVLKMFVVFSAVLVLAIAAPGVNGVYYPSVFRKMVSNCLASDDTVTCLSIKGIMALNRATRSKNVEIIPGISFRRYEHFLVHFQNCVIN